MAVYTTIDDSSQYFQTTLYSGNGGSNAVTFSGNSDMQPDIVWIKCTSNGSTNGYAWDSSRGVTKYIPISSANAESADAASLTAFGSDGFTMGDGGAEMNNSGRTYISWAWKVNGGTRVTNTESGDNPAGGYQVNTTSGISILDYTGTGGAGTKTHGLGVVPRAIFVHDRGGNNHAVYMDNQISSDPETDYYRLDTTLAGTDDSGRWNDTAPTSSVITLGSNNEVNGDDRTYVAWVFKDIQGFSKFGTYVGNGLSNGPFVSCGFKPALVVCKRHDATDNWGMHTTVNATNSGANPIDKFLAANSDSSNMDADMDLISNGFKIRTTNSTFNSDDGTYFYMAFAEHPMVSSDGVPCTAR